MMKKLLLLYIAALIVLFAPFSPRHAAASDANIESDLILPFFEALKEGDVDKIKSYLSAGMYKEYQALLDQNKEYPEFLKNYYRDARFSILRILEVNDGAHVDVLIAFPDGSRSINPLRVVKEGERLKISRKPFPGERGE